MDIGKLIAAERYDEAVAAAAQRISDPSQRSSDVVLTWLEYGFRTQAISADEVLLELETMLADQAELSTLVRGHRLRIRCLAAKRLWKSEENAWQTALDQVGDDRAILWVSRGDTLLWADRRPDARAAYDRALALDPDLFDAVYRSAHWFFVAGQFEDATSRLETLLSGQSDTSWGRAVRLLAACMNTTGQYDREVELWRTVRAARPDSDFAHSDALSLSYALAAAGQYRDAETILEELWRNAAEEPIGKHARRRLDHLQRALGDVGQPPHVKRLAAFPTVSQKHNYCGPAVLELCLRFLHIELTQDEIADVVKRQHGTPMFEITAFLSRHHIAARRIEATPEAIKKCIDLGLPVIVEEEYSVSTHVAVITGYDEYLGVFISQDPSTHRPSLKPNEWVSYSGDLHGNGGVVVLGRMGDHTEKLGNQLDQAGVVDAEHLEIMDAVAKRRRRVVGEGEEPLTIAEVIEHCQRACTIKPDFKYAWYRLTHALHGVFLDSGSERDRDEFLSCLYPVRARFPDDEWTHQMHARYLFWSDRHHEAYAEYLKAHRLDDQDSNNLSYMGECQLHVGNLQRARELMIRALRLEPDHVRAVEMLASLYVAQLETSTDRERDIDFGWIPAISRDKIEEPVDLGSADIARHARHFVAMACETNAENPFNTHTRARYLIAAGEIDRARDALDELAAEGNTWARAALIRVDIELGELDQALDPARALTEQNPRSPSAWLYLAEVQRRLEARDDGQDSDRDDSAVDGQDGPVATLLRAIDACSSGYQDLVEALYEAISDGDSGESAAVQITELARARSADLDLLAAVCETLDDYGHRGMAIELWRILSQQQPGNLEVLYRLGCLLSEDVLTREEAKSILATVIKYAPDFPAARQKLAWLLIDDAAEDALALLEPVLDAQNAYVYEAASAICRRLGRDEEAERWRTMALQVADEDPVEAVVRLIAHHRLAARSDLACDLCSLLSREVIFEHETARYWYLSCHMHAGRAVQILDVVKELCADEVPTDCAGIVFYAYRSVDYELAARAADTVASSESDLREIFEWRANAAGTRAKMGDQGPLDQLLTEVNDDGEDWASLYFALSAAERDQEAWRAADKAYELEPRNLQVLAAAENAALSRGQVDNAIRYAREALEYHPYRHLGDERLAALYARLGQVEEALPHSERAVGLAPFCHIAQSARAVTLFMAGDFGAASRHARRSLGIEPPEETDEDNDALMIERAVAGDVDGLERCIAERKKSEPLDNFPIFYRRLREVASKQNKPMTHSR
ncbi:MAG: tetratricopeptide repeat protein [Proteobacteria bacterium]|nr:tetratricopeptide repeat protein [Pseudomonadota bacterium]